MGASNHSGIWSCFTKTQGVPLLGLALSILLVSFVYYGFNVNNSLCNGGVSMTSMFTMPSSLSTPADHDVLNMTENQQRLENSANLLHCYLPWDLLTEFHLLECAKQIGQQHERNWKAMGEKRPYSRVAFLFVTRGEIPFEPVWRRFFLGHEELYSLYTHNTPNFRYPNTSLFYGHQVPSKIVGRLSISLVDAMRRLLAYSILDPDHGATNSWFVFLCDSSIPIRSFNFTYSYLTNSQYSFVESFLPVSAYLQWTTEPIFQQEQMRKGELWMALKRHHACMVLEDWSIYYKFKSGCNWFCGPDEQYIQTLLAIKDAQGIANRTVMYVDWTHIHTSSPFTYNVDDMTPTWFEDIQGRVVDTDGMYHDTSHIAKETNITSRSCYYNGVPESPCFLFFRKVASSTTEYLETLSAKVLGY